MTKPRDFSSLTRDLRWYWMAKLSSAGKKLAVRLLAEIDGKRKPKVRSR